jgi:hypothetical protein
MLTNADLLKSLAEKNTSAEEESEAMENLLIRLGFLRAKVICGIVYLDGSGEPIDIHSVARAILNVERGMAK